ncbi:MurR/RpiR family transcriptional regulator [Faecalibaculum rodentium]|uniref:MurR/RpiR family transcriptional regulator n=1 Tax=Faecalibaculum rodentium TaxID=1702221 RepID=UPI00257877CC|nr:MurR/RpiR family transcriptional regulator [Faecalibaculum rodentium]
MLKLELVLQGTGLSPAESGVNNYVLSHVDDLMHMTIRSLAEACYTTPTTVIRYCRKIGYSGFEEFKIRIRQDLSRYDFESYSIRRSEKPVEVINKLRVMHADVISKTVDLISLTQLEAIVQRIREAEVVDIIAFDANAALADYASHYFFQVGKICNVYEDINQQLMLAMYARPQDHVIFILSRSGLSPRVLKACQQLKANRQYAVAVTGQSGDELNCYCAHVLHALFKDDFREMGDLTFFTSAKFLFDCLINLYCTANYDEVLEKEKRYNDLYIEEPF